MIGWEGSRSLRPLAIGELLDRAVTIGVRAYVPLAIYIGVSALVSTSEIALGIDLVHLAHVFRNVPGAYRPTGSSDSRHPFFWSGWLVYLVALPNTLVSALTVGALIAYAARFALGEHVTVAEAYRDALRRWLAFVGLQVIGYVAIAVVMLVEVNVLALGAFFVMRHNGGVMTPLAIVKLGFLGLVILPAAIAFDMLATAAWFVAQCECLVARRSIAASLFGGMRIVCAPLANARRALLVGTAVAAIASTAVVVGLIGYDSVMAATHVRALASLVQTLAMSGPLGFAIVLGAVYYADVRVRADGFDLQNDVRSLRVTA